MSALMQRVRTLGAHEVGHTLGEAVRRGDTNCRYCSYLHKQVITRD
jgi:hypothetical protein